MKPFIILAAGLILLLTLSLAGAQEKPPGAELAGRLSCFACHSLAGQGGNLAQALDEVGSHLLPDQLTMILLRPRTHNPKASMPSYAYLQPHELQALINYLMSLQ